MGVIDNLHPALRFGFHPVCRSTDVPEGQIVAVKLLGEDWAVARSGGKLTAVRDLCPHRGAPISAGRVVAGELQCRYHGYRFAMDGHCTAIPALGEGSSIPAKAQLTLPHSLEERYGLVWLAPEEPVAPIVDVPEWDDPAFTICPLPDQSWQAGAGQMTENFLDIGHIAFLHEATFGDPDAVVVPNYTCDRDGFTFVCDVSHSAKLLSDSGGAEPGAEEFDVASRRSTWWYQAPFTLRLRIEYPVEKVVLTILFFHQPVDATTTKLYAFDLRNDIKDGRTTLEDAVAFQMAVGAEDKSMLEAIPSKATPLDLQAEVHTRADRNTVEMRRVLADLVDHARQRHG
jgi:phenylpropionate dioxygenase-like ring-hydroxylating dioxygenase large terminal subunit